MNVYNVGHFSAVRFFGNRHSFFCRFWVKYTIPNIFVTNVHRCTFVIFYLSVQSRPKNRYKKNGFFWKIIKNHQKSVTIYGSQL